MNNQMKIDCFKLIRTVHTKQREAGSSVKVLEQEATLQQSQETIEKQSKQIAVLEGEVKELEKKLQLADAKGVEKV